MQPKGQLPRMPSASYRGMAYVFWTYTMEDRAKGWLNAEWHRDFREGLLHTLARYHLSCPIYVLMPDHIHFIWIGCARDSDQLKASSFFRKYLNGRLKPVRLQRQAHDHILCEHELEQQRFTDTVAYVRLNPVRAGFVPEASDWPYTGAMVPGYPDLAYGEERFWERFWKCMEVYVNVLHV